LWNTTRALKSWSDHFISKEAVLQLEMARDRSLAAHEEALRQDMKHKTLGLSSLQLTIARQESTNLWLGIGDTPTKFFHVHANVRHRKKFIRSIDQDGQVLVLEDRKAEAFHTFFDEILGTPAKSHIINLD
jgi:hypothetical protein